MDTAAINNLARVMEVHTFALYDCTTLVVYVVAILAFIMGIQSGRQSV